MDAITKLLAVARAEIGYLEKATNSHLDDKAARTFGIDHSNIGAACYGIQAACGGFIWKFADISQ